MPDCFCGKTFFARETLPSRRGGYNFDFIVGSTRFTASVGTVAGRVKEIFLNSDKIDSDVDLTMRDAAVVISIALQYGIRASEMCHSIGRNVDGKASSPIGAILDILARAEDDAVTFTQNSDTKVKISGPRQEKAKLSDQLLEARLKGYEGQACNTCRNFTLVRNGTCLKCNTCGSTTGCS